MSAQEAARTAYQSVFPINCVAVKKAESCSKDARVFVIRYGPDIETRA